MMDNSEMTDYQKTFHKIRRETFGSISSIDKVISARRAMQYDCMRSCEDVCDGVFLSRSHFTRLFKKVYGQPPLRYLHELRMARSRTLLENGMSVTDVCFEVGYLSLPSFIHRFRSYYGITPGDAKKQKSISRTKRS